MVNILDEKEVYLNEQRIIKGKIKDTIIGFFNKDHFSRIVKYLLIYANVSFGFTLLVYSLHEKIPISYVVQDIGFLGFEINAIFFLFFLLIGNIVFPLCLLFIENCHMLYKSAKTKVERIILFITLTVFPILVLISFLIFCYILYDNSIELLCNFIIIFIFYTFLYVMYRSVKSYFVMLFGLIIAIVATLFFPIDQFFLKGYGTVPREKSEYFLKGNQENSGAIQEILAVYRIKHGSSSVFKSEDGDYISNPDVLKAVMVVGDYVYFKEYGSFIRVKKDDVVLLGVRKEPVHDAPHSSSATPPKKTP